MRKIAFGYSTRCNVKCSHCVADNAEQKQCVMELSRAKECIADLAMAGVTGISFTAGEPLLYLNDICVLLNLCRRNGMYTRLVSNAFWAATAELADSHVIRLKESGLSQLRISFSRWHQENIPAAYCINAAESCIRNGVEYFISFVTDFTEEDDALEDSLRKQNMKFFPEPVIFSGRAASFQRDPLRTDYQANCCAMNPYLAPDLNMYACCDAGSHFTRTNFFHLGNVEENSVADLFKKSERNSLYNHIRSMGITAIASFAGFRAREIIGYRKCELCEKLFNSPDTLKMLEDSADSGLQSWYR